MFKMPVYYVLLIILKIHLGMDILYIGPACHTWPMPLEVGYH